MQRPAQGFSLTELLIALAILALLVGFALPGFNGAVAASHSSSTRAALLATLTRAVSQSALTAQHVVVCSSRDQATCSGESDWSGGWIAFVDLDQNRAPGPGERQILSQAALDPRVRLATSRGRTRLVFQPNGGNAGSNVTFTLCDSRGPGKAQSLVLSNFGRLHEGTPDPARLASICP